MLSPKGPTRRKISISTTAGLAVSAAALAVLFLRATGFAPTRILDLELTGAPIGVRGGRLLFAGAGGTGVEEVDPISKARRSVAPPFELVGTVRNRWVTASGVVLRAVENPIPGAPAQPVSNDPRLRDHLWLSPFDGSPAHEILASEPKTSAMVSDSNCYWLRPDPSYRGKDPFAQRVDLLQAPLIGGGPRIIARGLSAYIVPDSLGEGVTWIVTRPTGRVDRYWALPPLYSVVHLPDCRWGYLRQLGDHVFWIEEPPGNERRSSALMSANADGSNRCASVDLTGGGKWGVGGSLVGVHGNRLYALLPVVLPPGIAQAEFALCEVGVGGMRQIGRLQRGATPASSTWFDGSFFYYTVLERRENWWDWSRGGLEGRRVQALYRMALPN